jgi:hypothetical protein
MKALDETFFINGEGKDRAMKKRLPLLLGGAACLLVAGYFLHAWLTKTSINRDTFERIEEGMTLKEVEELIGLPPGEYEKSVIYWLEPDFGMRGECKSWSSDDGAITVWVSPEGKVTHKDFYEPLLRENTLDMLRRWVGFRVSLRSSGSIRANRGPVWRMSRLVDILLDSPLLHAVFIPLVSVISVVSVEGGCRGTSGTSLRTKPFINQGLPELTTAQPSRE